MSAAAAVIDLDDVEGLLGADREGMLRAASMAGAHVRATAAAVAEGALAPVSDGQRPRSVIWVAARGPAAAAGAVLASLLAGVAALFYGLGVLAVARHAAGATERTTQG